MKNWKRIVLLAALLIISSFAFVGVSVAGAASGPPPITLSATSGPAGTSITITLPTPCTVPAYDAADPNALTVTISNVSQEFGGVVNGTSQEYAGTPGVPITEVIFAVPTDLVAGHYTVSGSCSYAPAYGPAYFVITGGSPLATLTVSPASGAAGSVVDVTGACASAEGQGSASLYVLISSASDPNIDTLGFAYGLGPTITVPVTLPASFLPGSYFVSASCNNYVSYTEFAESPFVVTGTTTSTSLSTSLTGPTGTGASVEAGVGVGVTDSGDPDWCKRCQRHRHGNLLGLLG